MTTYPVERTRLKKFSQLLIPNEVEPVFIRPVELTAVILLLVASNRGVNALSQWVIRVVKYSSDRVTISVNAKSIKCKLYFTPRPSDLTTTHFTDLTKWAGQEAQPLHSQ